MDKILGTYKNGNYDVTIYEDGTKVRENDLDYFESAFPENIDIKISNRCDMGCPMCHEMSTINGDNADLMNLKFIDTLHPYTELAIGGGNVFENPDFIPFLEKLKSLNVIANITVNQIHFEQHFDEIVEMVIKKLIYGVGVSLVNVTSDFIKKVKFINNAVVHVINGVVSEDQIKKLSGYDLKILILGYKVFGRGLNYLLENTSKITERNNYLYDNLEFIFPHFKVVSFDNLAITQLNPKRFLTEEQYSEFYMGDDGQFTMYIDAVKEQFGKNSTATTRYSLMNNIEDMFSIVKKES